MGVKALVDPEGYLVEADPLLADLHRKAGGAEGGKLAVPQIAAIAALAKKLNAPVSRAAIAADGKRDVELIVSAEPHAAGVSLTIGNWEPAELQQATPASQKGKLADFARADADWGWEVNAELNFASTPPAIAPALSKTPDGLTGQPFTSLFRLRENEDGSLPILAGLAARAAFHDQLAELRINGAETYRLTGEPMFDPSGKFSGYRGSATCLAMTWASDRDHDAPEAEGRGIFGEKLDRALRDPLSQIVEQADEIGRRGQGPLGSTYAEYGSDIASAARHLLSLVDDLVDLQAIERPDFKTAGENIDLANAGRKAGALLAISAEERGIALIMPPEGQSLPATGELRRVHQIVVNLVTNAIRYSEDGGQVVIEAHLHEGRPAISVCDEGKGIHPSDQNRIFEKFERVDPLEPGGTGLGLYTSRRLARAMGGDILIRSAVGEGARFTLTLPCE